MKTKPFIKLFKNDETLSLTPEFDRVCDERKTNLTLLTLSRMLPGAMVQAALNRSRLFVAFVVLSTISYPLSIRAQGTAFTYQGRLNDGSAPANGLYDLRFSIYDASANGNQAGGSITNLATDVSNGLFTVTLDFGGIFTGTNYWLDIGVRTNGTGAFTAFTSRPPVRPAPYAIFANSASNLFGSVPAAQLSGVAGAATNFTGTLNGDVTGMQSATVVSLVGGQSAGNVAAGANAANFATNANTPSTIVKRDASGNFSAGTLALSGALNLPGTTPTILSGGNLLLHDVGGAFFAGQYAGSSMTFGVSDVGIGFFSLYSATTGGENTAIGAGTLSNDTTGQDNTAVGLGALGQNTSGSFNVGVGAGALNDNSTGRTNTGVGYLALLSNTNGAFNTAIGYNSLANNRSGSGNIGLGSSAGRDITTGNNNIEIGNAGAAADNNVIRVGTQGTQSSAFIAGIFGATVSGGAQVLINSSGQLGTLTSSARYKQNIEKMGDASDVLLALQPVTFQYKPDIDPQAIPQFGLIAEQVEKVDPDLVVHDQQHGIYSVRYEAVNAMLLNEFLKQHQKLEDQSAEIQRLQQSVAELKAIVSESAQKRPGLRD